MPGSVTEPRAGRRRKCGQDRKQQAKAKAASWHHVTEANGPRERQTSRGPFGSMQTDGDESQAYQAVNQPARLPSGVVDGIVIFGPFSPF